MTSKNSFFSNKVQELHASLDGDVTQSSNTIFELKQGENIYSIHPFFESLKSELIHSNEMNLAFPCVQLDINEKTFICDITIKKERGELAILFFDYSTHYEHLHEAAQEKKTAMLNEQAHELEIKHTEEKQSYLNYMKDRMDSNIIGSLEEVVTGLEALKKSDLTADQHALINEIEQNVGRLHLKAIQIKEGLEFNFD